MSEFEAALIGDLRAHRGEVTSGPFVARPMLVLTTTGACSGTARETPVLYSGDEDVWVIVASNDGPDAHPAWFHNLVANPHATIEVDGQAREVAAEFAADERRSRLYDRHAALHPSFLGYPAMTSRVIPVVVLRHVTSPAPA